VRLAAVHGGSAERSSVRDNLKHEEVELDEAMSVRGNTVG
jgi:hypothetical protein